MSSLTVKRFLHWMILPGLCLGLAFSAYAQDALTADPTKSQSQPTYRSLLASTYLGHASEMPEPNEPVEVLLAYLEQNRSSHEAQVDVTTVNNAVTRWKQLVQKYPDSRYALFGLGRAYRKRAGRVGSTKDLHRTADAFIQANALALSRGRILYTREIGEIAAQLHDPDMLDDAFAPTLAVGHGLKSKEFLLALTDYADALAQMSDNRAWDRFEQALKLFPETRIEVVNRYGARLLEKGRAQEALDMIESRLSRNERVRYGKPAFLRKQALQALGRDTASADDEIQEIRQRRRSGKLADKAGELAAVWEKFVHSNSTDDCRSTTYAQNLQCDSTGSCYYPYEVNLAEILWNEARSEPLGAKDMVGWTVRDRAFERVSCDAYPGGTTSSCRSTVPCGDPSNCAVSQYYCCVEHGGTTAVGSSSLQFNDAHVTIANLESSGLLDEAFYIIIGAIPEPSNNYIPPGLSGCTTGCGGFCSTGTNYTSPSPQGPMEYRASNYCAAAQSCKWYAKNVCGNNPVPASCSTGGNTGDNHFWNRLN
ncbi:MAG: tetratricopeptide repeat protein [Thermoanaerobaculia bacterium]